MALGLNDFDGDKFITKAIGQGGPRKIETFFGLERATSETHALKTTHVPGFFILVLWLNDFDGGNLLQGTLEEMGSENLDFFEAWNRNEWNSNI